MKNINIQDVPSIIKPANGSVPHEQEKSPVDEAPRERHLSWSIVHANELVSTCAVVMVLTIAAGALSTAAGGSPPWVDNHPLFYALVVILSLSFLGFCFFAWQAARGEEIMAGQATYVLSEWSLKTLNASGLPADLAECLEEILGRAKKESPPKTELPAFGRERLPGTWVSDLEAALGKSRVAEFEEMLFKYTARESKA